MLNEDEVDVVRRKDPLKETCDFFIFHSGRRISTQMGYNAAQRGWSERPLCTAME